MNHLCTRTLPFVPADPLSLWRDIHPHPHHGFFLGSGAGIENDHLIFFSAGEPAQPLSLTLSQNGRGDHIFPLPRGEGGRRPGEGNNLPRYVGFLGFEAGRFFDDGLARLPKKPNPLQTPTALFGEYDNVVRVDLEKQETTIVARNKKELKRIQEAITKYNFPSPLPAVAAFWRRRVAGRGNPFRYLSRKEFSSRVIKAKRAIARGDIYQANLSIRFERSFHGDPIELYRLLCVRNPSPYAALLKFGPKWIVSSSPELLLETKGRNLRTRPIAGTRPRGETVVKDAKLKGQLLLSPKERAEHIMLVDLERNDMGRVSVPGSVHVTERFAIERYSHVMHIVSEVQGKLAKRKTSFDALKAVFPGGTITGCPKIRSVQIIEGLEQEARGPFYGSAGYFSGHGDAKFNILIRTALVQNKKVFVQAGAGIVADSNPLREYKEIMAKAQALLEAIRTF